MKLDRVVESQVLMDADALGAAFGKPVESCRGLPAVRLELDERFRGVFTPPLTDLRAFDQIVMVFITEGGGVKPALGIELTTRTEGLDAPDSFNTGHAPDITAEEGDWSRYPFPWENFLVFRHGRVGAVRCEKFTLSIDALPGTTLWLAELASNVAIGQSDQTHRRRAKGSIGRF